MESFFQVPKQEKFTKKNMSFTQIDKIKNGFLFCLKKSKQGNEQVSDSLNSAYFLSTKEKISC